MLGNPSTGAAGTGSAGVGVGPVPGLFTTTTFRMGTCYGLPQAQIPRKTCEIICERSSPDRRIA